MRDSERYDREPARRLIRSMLALTGWSPSRLAREAGLAHTTVSRFLNYDVDYQPSLRTVRKLTDRVVERVQSFSPELSHRRRAAIDEFSDALAHFGPALEGTRIGLLGDDPGGRAVEVGRWDRKPAAGSSARSFGSADELPIYTTARADNAAMLITPEPIAWIARPDPLFAVRTAFAIYMVGDSMAPVFEQGDLLLVHPARPPTSGDDVLLLKHSLEDPSKGLVKRLISWTDARWRVRQWSPAEDKSLRQALWPVVYPIVGKYRGR